MIIYEYPFSERIRTYLRLEHLLRRLGELIERDSALDHHFALASIFQIMEVCDRADLKSDVLKDLEKHKHALQAYLDNPAISQTTLLRVLQQLDTSFEQLNQQAGKAGHALTDNDWLMSVRNRILIPGGTCEFDLPAYHAWQHRAPSQRRADLQRWAATLSPLATAVFLLLKLLRDSGSAQKVYASEGQFQQNLPQGRTFQLLRLALDPASGLIPEISGNRLLVSIRLMQQTEDDRLQPSQQDASFELTLCA